MKLRAALYERVSTQQQAEEGFSIDAQTERLTKFAESKDYQIIRHYTDAGYSGAKVDRPALQEMIRDIEKNKIDIVLVYKLDRLSRSQKHTLFLIEDIFLKNDVQFVSMSESFDTTTPYGRAMVGLLSVFAQLERDSIRERTKMGISERAKAGYYHGGSTIPIGYDYTDGLLEVNEYEAMIVRKIFELYDAGKGITYIGKYISKNFPSQYGMWDSSLAGILRNKIYIGKINHKGQIFDGLHEPILEEDLFYRVSGKIVRNGINKKKAFTRTRLLTGIMYCGYCGARIAGRVSGEKRKYYN